MKQNTEQEWQFSAAHLDGARAWLAAQPREASERHLAAVPALDLEDTYFDSSDWMIFRAGFALRLRREQVDSAGTAQFEVTLKSLHAPHQGIARRQEFSEIVSTGSIEEVIAGKAQIGARIRELIGNRPLATLFHAHTRRERQRLIEAGSTLPLAEVDLDHTSIDSPGGGALQFNRVEVECLNAEAAALEPFVSQLREAAQLEPVQTSKFRSGLDAAGLAPAEAPALGNTEISAGQPFAETQFALLRRYFSVLLEKEPQVRAGSVESVHAMRVAARHVDVLLLMFRGYGPRWAVGSRGTVKTLTRALGAVRDCDVQLQYFDAAKIEALQPLRQRLERRHAAARARLLHLLDGARFRSWAENWREQLLLGTSSSARARQVTTGRVAGALIRDFARKLRKRARKISGESTPEEFHEVRIRAKRLRYALDAFAELYGEPAQQFTRALAKMQTLLGDCNDSTVRAQTIADLATRGRKLPAATSFMAGRLAERDLISFSDCRRGFDKAFRRIRRRRWRELEAAMQTLEGANA